MTNASPQDRLDTAIGILQAEIRAREAEELCPRTEVFGNNDRPTAALEEAHRILVELHEPLGRADKWEGLASTLRAASSA